MMPVMVTPVVVMPVVADPARAIIGPDHPAAMVRIIIRVVVIGRVEVPVKAMVPKPEPTVAEAAAVENMAAVKSATVENMSGAKSTAMETAAVKRRTSTMEAAATVKTAATVASPTAMTTATMTTTAMAAAADFGRQPVGGVCHCWRRARTDQR